jgi:AraC family transcriptional regulator of adaptative response/methylated-DNA-[protein]-cysteine methyltransferase
MLSRQKKFYRNLFSPPPKKKAPPEKKDVFTYAAGRCGLGHVLAAFSADGIVAVLIRPKAADLLPALRKTFPRAVLRADEAQQPMLKRIIAFIEKPSPRMNLPLDMRGTLFQRRVWQAVMAIPPGKIASYAEIAAAINAPRAVRAVGSSCTRCIISYLIPCHRVLHKGESVEDVRAASPRKYAYLQWDKKALGKRGRRA